MKKILSLALLFAGAATACSKKSAAPIRAKTSAVASLDASTNQPAWNWDAFPAVRRMRLGMLPCTLQPRSQIVMNSTLAGTLKLYVNVPQTNLQAGVVFGEFDPAIFELEAKALEEARVKLDEREKFQREVEIPRLRLKAERELKDTKRNVDMVEYLATHPEMADLTLSAGDSKSQLRPDAVADARQELQLANQSLVYIQETNSVMFSTDVGTLRLNWERQRAEFERKRAQATLKMPFNGQLTITMPLADGLADYPVNAGQEIAVARDLSIVRLRVPIANSAWNAIPPERLFAVVRLPSGQQMEAQFAYNKVETKQNREESAYYFQFLPEHTHLISRLIGTDVTCELWLNLGQITRVVPKLALIMHNPKAFQSGNWSVGVGEAFPGAHLAVEGQTDLGIVLPTKNVVASR